MIVGIDIGGTFTDVVYFDGKSFSIGKVPTTPEYPAEGALNSLKQLTISDIDVLVHASTLGTNTFLGQEKLKLPKIALVTTKGFRDVIEIGRQKRPELYNLYFEKPKPIVRREDRYEVEERIGPDGEVLTPLNVDELKKLCIKLSEYEVVVVSFLHSYANPSHEIEAKKIIENLCPNVEVVTSYEINPEYKEYERTSTTVINAALRPLISRYLSSLLSSLKNRGFRGKFLVMQSNGGISNIENAIKRPAAFIESGPAAGAVAVAHFSKLVGVRNAIGFDMGGTTAKASTIVEHEPSVTLEYEIGGRVHAGRLVKGSGYPVRFPFIDLAEVSAGGGTIAWIDEGGALRVGPISAGADPGPACYGRGNDRATITDANFYLGRLGDELGGGILKLRKELSEAAISKLADELGSEREEVALGILKIANNVMAKALRIVTVERGHDPREFTMFAFGGAGPLHAAYLAEELEISKIIVPQHAGVFSAFGLLFADYRSDKVRSIIKSAEEVEESEIEEIYDELCEEAVKEIEVEDVRVSRYADLRYKGQAYELTVPWMGDVESTVKAFHERHESLYGFSSPEDEVELVNLRVTAVGIIEKPGLNERSGSEYRPKAEERRDVFFEDWIETPVFKRNFEPGAVIEGPAVIEDYDSTILIPPEYVARVDGFGNVVIERW